MVYRVFRAFDGSAGRVYQPGELLTDPGFPAENLKTLINQKFLVVHDNTPRPEASAEKDASPRRQAGRTK